MDAAVVERWALAAMIRSQSSGGFGKAMELWKQWEPKKWKLGNVKFEEEEEESVSMFEQQARIKDGIMHEEYMMGHVLEW